MQAVCCAIKKIPTNVLSHSFNYYIIRIHHKDTSKSMDWQCRAIYFQDAYTGGDTCIQAAFMLYSIEGNNREGT